MHHKADARSGPQHDVRFGHSLLSQLRHLPT